MVFVGGSLSSHIRSIPAAQSEYAAINGLDPVMLAQLALKDAQRAGSLTPDSASPLALQVPAARAQPRTRMSCSQSVVRDWQFGVVLIA